MVTDGTHATQQTRTRCGVPFLWWLLLTLQEGIYLSIYLDVQYNTTQYSTTRSAGTSATKPRLYKRQRKRAKSKATISWMGGIQYNTIQYKLQISGKAKRRAFPSNSSSKIGVCQSTRERELFVRTEQSALYSCWTVSRLVHSFNASRVRLRVWMYVYKWGVQNDASFLPSFLSLDGGFGVPIPVRELLMLSPGLRAGNRYIVVDNRLIRIRLAKVTSKESSLGVALHRRTILLSLFVSASPR